MRKKRRKIFGEGKYHHSGTDGKQTRKDRAAQTNGPWKAEMSKIYLVVFHDGKGSKSTEVVSRCALYI